MMEDNVKMDFKGISLKAVESIHMVHERGQ
jgi:hypothetical protein